MLRGPLLKKLPFKKQNSPNRHVVDRETAFAGTRSPTGRMHPGDTLVFGHMSKPFGQVVCKGMRGLIHPRDIGQVTRCCRRPAQPVASAVLVVVVPSSSSPSSSFSFFASLRRFVYRPFSLPRTRSSLYSPPASTRSPPGPLPVYTWHEGGKIHKTRVCALTLSCAAREYKRPSTEIYRTIPHRALIVQQKRVIWRYSLITLSWEFKK